MNKPVVGRFAPSPSGYLHMGNLLSLLLAWLDCRSLGGELIFRLEDLDPARSKKEYSEAMISDLRWLGLDWDRGYPEEPQYAQSARTELYEAAFETLRRRDLAYPCWCTRAQRLAAASAPHPGERDRDPGCPCAGLTREERRERLASGKAPAWKLRCPDEKVRLLDGHYGMVEQTGAIYMQCECGHLHASNFSDVLIRRGGDFSLCENGERGIVQVVSALPYSYPGHSILTQDEGTIMGEDDCPCGRKGKYFVIHGRLKNAEVRGCSDTFERK